MDIVVIVFEVLLLLLVTSILWYEFRSHKHRMGFTNAPVTGVTGVTGVKAIAPLLSQKACLQIGLLQFNDVIESFSKGWEHKTVHGADTQSLTIEIRKACLSYGEIESVTAIAALLTQSVNYVDPDLLKPVALSEPGASDFGFSPFLTNLNAKDIKRDVQLEAHLFFLKGSDVLSFNMRIEPFFSNSPLCALKCSSKESGDPLICGCKNNKNGRCLTTQSEVDFKNIDSKSNLANYAVLYNVDLKGLYIGL